MTDYSLPIQYQEVEYIQTTGTQYIDTGVVSNHGNSFEMSVYGDTPGGDGHILSQGNNSIRESSSRVVRWFSRNYNFMGILTADIYNKLEFGLNYLKINGNSASPTNDSDNAVGNVRLFCSNLNTTQCATLKMAYCKIWDSNSELVRRFVPCYRIIDGVIGLYDKVNNTFYTNNGTGTFGKGGNVIARNPINYKLGTNNLLKVCIGNVKVRPPNWKPGANTIAYYPLTSSTTTTDQSGNSRNLTNNGTLFGTYQGVDCAYLTTATKYLLTPTLTGSDIKTISVWAYWDGTFYPPNISDFAQLLNYGILNGSTSIYIYNNKDGKLHFENNVGTNYQILTPYVSGTWYNLVITIGTDTKMYINGNYIGSCASGTLSNGKFIFGTWIGTPSSTDKYSGGISNWIIENKVRTQSEISDYYNQTKSNYGL